jgi:hypothetical protein
MTSVDTAATRSVGSRIEPSEASTLFGARKRTLAFELGLLAPPRGTARTLSAARFFEPARGDHVGDPGTFVT